LVKPKCGKEFLNEPQICNTLSHYLSVREQQWSSIRQYSTDSRWNWSSSQAFNDRSEILWN